MIHYLSNLDSENWSNPLAFNPDRFLKGSGEGKEKGTLFVPFGSGKYRIDSKRFKQMIRKHKIFLSIAKSKLLFTL